MTGTQGRTREQLRRSIGRNLIGHRLIVSLATAAGEETSLIDDTLLGGDDNYNGWWLVANAGEIRRVSDYDSATSRLSWTRPLAQATTVNDSYELWPSEYPPEVIHDYIGQAIGEAAGHIYEPVEDFSLQAGGVTRFPIPEGVDVISKVQIRVSAASMPVQQAGGAVDRSAAVWRTLPAHLWGTDKGERVLTLTEGGRRLAGKSPLKLVGGREPSALSTDASTTVVPDEFIIARATALALLASPDLSESGRAASERWEAQTQDARAAFPLLTNVRRVG